ncbi:DUF2752 domain-containing protein [Apibacter sp. wkB309]|nr:DUF2752 domain-containing protein [Apibacter sp. wkB309]
MLIKILRNRGLMWFSLLTLITFLCIYYYVINPNKTNLALPCLFKLLTGLNCTGCGGQRAFHFLLHGEFLQATRYNILIYFLPFLLYALFASIQMYIFKSKKYVIKFIFSNEIGILILVFLIIFTFLRNIPYEPFIYLAPPK